MDGPSCRTEKLAISERNGVEIDYCPSCRGVWLDRGELDKIIERSGRARDGGGRDRVAQDRGRDDDRGGILDWITDIFD